MVKKEESSEQAASIKELTQRIETLEKDEQETWGEKIESLTLISIDIDRFKEINESLGHHAGDIILQEIAQSLNRVIDHSAGELLARLEGDEFALVLPNTEIDRAKEVAARIKNIISKPIHIGSNIISIDCSIGMASYPEHSDDKLKLIQYAESAMYDAKANKQGIGTYNPEIHKITTERLQLVTDLREALTNKQIVPYYQPIININNPDEIRIEALARWNHKSKGYISPEVFIRLAEEIGVINMLTTNILAYSIKDCADLLKLRCNKKTFYKYLSLLHD